MDGIERTGAQYFSSLKRRVNDLVEAWEEKERRRIQRMKKFAAADK